MASIQRLQISVPRCKSHSFIPIAREFFNEKLKYSTLWFMDLKRKDRVTCPKNLNKLILVREICLKS